MQNSNWKKRAGMFCLALVMTFMASAGSYGQSLQEAKQEKKELENALKEAEALVDSLKSSKADIKGKVTELDGKLTEISTDITNLESQLEVKNTEISDTAKELEQVKEDERTQYENMKRRIRYIYENSRTSYVEQLLCAENFSDFLNLVEYIQQLSSYDRAMLKRYQETQKAVEDTQSVLEQEKAELEEMKGQVQEEKKAVQTLLTAKETELASVNESLDKAASEADAYAAEIAAQNEIIEQIKQAEAAKKKAEEEARKRAEEEAKANGGVVTELPGDTYSGGAFVWPCPSSTRITSEYGNRISPTAGASSNHKGIDIGAAYGADIVAAAEGTVIFSGYGSAAGNYIMIDHGGSLYTVYMHASTLCVEKGDKVTKGQVVAKVGSTGISTGNHLHFGVSLNGSYVSPWNYLSK